MEKLVIAGREFNSRLFLGTGKFNNNALMAEAIKASETEMVTVAMKRIELEDKQDDLLTHIVQSPSIQLLPNTSAVRCRHPWQDERHRYPLDLAGGPRAPDQAAHADRGRLYRSAQEGRSGHRGRPRAGAEGTSAVSG